MPPKPLFSYRKTGSNSLSIDLDLLVERVPTLASSEEVVSIANIDVEHQTSNKYVLLQKKKKSSCGVLGFLACRVTAGRP